MNTHYVQLQDGKIAYEEIGQGPLVICVPGLGDLRGEYRFLLPQLASAGFRALSLDLRGHGESSVEWLEGSVAAVGADILALVRSLDAGPAIVIGTSMGAGAAVWAAAEAPEIIAGLVLLGPAVHGEVNAFNRLLYSALFSPPWGVSAWIQYFTTLFPTRQPPDFDTYTAALRQNLKQPGRLNMVKKMVLAPKTESEVRLASVTSPALIVMGTKDPDFKPPEAEARWVADQVNGKVEMIEGAGHYPHVEMPEIAGPVILSFLQTLQTKEITHVA